LAIYRVLNQAVIAALTTVLFVVASFCEPVFAQDVNNSTAPGASVNATVPSASDKSAAAGAVDESSSGAIHDTASDGIGNTIIAEGSIVKNVGPPQGDIDTIERLTTEVLKKEIEFERFYTRYRVKGNEEPKYRYDRYFAFQQTAAALTLAAVIPGITEPGKYLDRPERVNQRVLKNATTTGMIGIIFQGGSSALELGSNTLLTLKHIIKKEDPGSARKYVTKVLKEIDALLAQRLALVEKHRDSDDYKIWSVETLLLKLFRDGLVYEFANVYADVRSEQSSSNVYYGLDVASCGAYLASYVLGLQSFDQERFANPSSVEGIIGDAIGVVSAPASSYSYYVLYDYWYKKIGKQLNEKLYDSEPELKKQVAVLEKLLATTDPQTKAALGPVDARIKMYMLWADRFDEFTAKQTIDWRHSSKVALQSNISGPLISGAFLAQDISGVIAATKYKNNLKAQNTLFFATSIPTTVASVANLGLSTYWWVDNKLFTRKLRKQNALPRQLMEHRLTTLNELEQMISK
jgi:hypothetical protein